MLYERWRETARAHRAETALIECVSGRQWTFERLAADSERTRNTADTLSFPTGADAEFVLSVLRAWRDKTVLCPLEEGQTPANVPTPPRGCIHLKTTSASTGAPRPIAFTAEQLMADADQIVATMRLRPEWPNVGVISLAHSYGFSNLVLPLLLHGIPLILGSSPLPESLRQASEFASDVTLAAVPALWRTWMEAVAIPNNVRLAISAGAPLPLALEKAVWDRCGIKIHNFYGASECGGIAYDSTTTPRHDPANVGTAMNGVELDVSSDGCLMVHSQAVGLTYWPDPAPALGNGIFQTSDLARIENGSVFLLGRQSDLINVAGRKVSPESIEQALAMHPDVSGCLVFGAPSLDEDRTEMIVACVVANSTKATAQSFREHLLALLPAWQVPRDWWFVPDLQTNTRGKLARSDWRKKYRERQKV